MSFSFHKLRLLPAKLILAAPREVPKGEGVYGIFFAGGAALLRATSYSNHATAWPLADKEHVHLYTGASQDLLARSVCHLTAQSNLRKTLIATEFARRAISRTNTPSCNVKDKYGLDEWLLQNANFAFIRCDDARGYERRLLQKFASPLNIRCQMSLSFAQQLQNWRRKFRDQCKRF